MEQIRAYCESISMRSGEGVKLAMRHHKLPARLRKHAYTIASQLFRCPLLASQLSEKDQRRIYRRFREYENAWDSNRSASFKQGRSYFPSYRVLVRKILAELHLAQYLELFPPLRARKVQRRTELMIEVLSDKL